MVGKSRSPREKPTPKTGQSRARRLGRKMEGLRGSVANERAVRPRQPAQAPPRVSSEAAISSAACKINVIGIMLQFDLSTGFN